MDCEIISNEDLNNWTEVDPDYKDIVLKAVCSNKNMEIENSDMEHAKFLSYLLIKKAQKSIRIFTGKLKETFYANPKIFEAFKEAVERGVIVQIITSNNPEKSSFLDFSKKNKEKLKISRLNFMDNAKNHFLVSDDSAYRLEAPHTDKDIELNKVKGMVNFNDPKFAKDVSLFFDKTLLENSVGI